MAAERKRVLWIPHVSWDHSGAQRPRVLAEQLADRFDIHVLTWAARPKGGSRWGFYLNPLAHLAAARTRVGSADRLPVHRAAVTLPVVEAVLRRYPPGWAVGPCQWLFRRSIRRLHRRFRFDAVVTGPSHRLTGFPPPLPGVPVVFDYVDLFPDDVEAGYVRAAARVVTVSHTLADRVTERYGRPAAVIPNGIHAARLRAADGARGRARWGLAGKKVVSLIGLTCSPRLYFLDALARVRADVPDLVFLAVGTGSVADPIAARCRQLGLPVVMTGWVDPAEVGDLFAATDVGLYPGDDIPYFDAACPIKVLEYVAAGVPVVTNRTAELVRLALSGVEIRPAAAEPFADAVRGLLAHRPTHFPDMTGYDWANVAGRFGDEIDRAISPPAAGPGPA